MTAELGTLLQAKLYDLMAEGLDALPLQRLHRACNEIAAETGRLLDVEDFLELCTVGLSIRIPSSFI